MHELRQYEYIPVYHSNLQQWNLDSLLIAFQIKPHVSCIAYMGLTLYTYMYMCMYNIVMNFIIVPDSSIFSNYNDISDNLISAVSHNYLL